MSESIKKIGIPTAAIAVALVLMGPAMLPTGAFAQEVVTPTDTTRSGGLHFVGTPTVTADKTDGAFLTASGEVAGAGTGAGTATLSATVTETAQAPFEPTRQGRAEFTVTTDPVTIEDFNFNCPSERMTETLVGPVTFSDIVLTIEAQTGTITATFPDVDP